MMTGLNILVVDDDAMFRETLIGELSLYESFVLVEAATGREALEKATSNSFDAIIMDVDLSDMDGRQVCRLVRRVGISTPIILLTATDTDADTILGLDAGADDCLVKPFQMGVLLARLRAHIRQHARSKDAAYVIGPYRFDPFKKTLLNYRTDKKIRLTYKEAEILNCLYAAGAQVVPPEVLLRKVWNYNSRVETHTVQTHIHRLRKKMEPDPSDPKFLVTETGGYRLIPKGRSS